MAGGASRTVHPGVARLGHRGGVRIQLTLLFALAAYFVCATTFTGLLVGVPLGGR